MNGKRVKPARYLLTVMLPSLGIVAVLALLKLLDRSPSTAFAQAPDGYTTYYVATGGDCGSGISPCFDTVQAAVDAADTPQDTVKVAAGTYTDVHVRAGITQAVYISKTVTIRGGYTTTDWNTSDPEANPTTLDARGQGRGLYIIGHISPTVEGLNITGGDADGLGGYTIPFWQEIFDVGGGIYVITATPSILSNQVLSNAAEYGGGLYLRASAAVITGNTISLNTAELGGGLFLEESDAELDSSFVIANTAMHGGGLYLHFSDATLVENIVSLNIAGLGGGLHLADSDASLDGNTISLNTAEQGGGLNLLSSVAAMSGNTIAANTATSMGGGMCLLYGSDVTLFNNLVVDNQAHELGSGLYVGGSSPRLLHTTIAHNRGGDSTGMIVDDYVSFPTRFLSTVALTNTIIADHAVGINAAAGNTVTLEATLWGSGGWANTIDWEGAGAVATGTHVYWGDPGFVCTGDTCPIPYHIGPDSAARDAGVSTGATTDIDGELRPAGAAYDIGADEYYSSSLSYVLAPAEERPLLAFYYPWFHPTTWDDPAMLDQPLVPYDSSDPTAIAQHLTWARAAGIDGLIVSWTGWENTFVDGCFSQVLDRMSDTDLRTTIYFETRDLNFDEPVKVIQELEYALDTYGDHPNFLRHDGRPVIFLYAVDGVAVYEGLTPFETWQRIVDTLHADGYDPFFVADTVDPIYLSIFDGLHTYFARHDVSVYQDVSCLAHQVDKLWAANIYPGYDDSLLWWYDPFHMRIPRENGQTYSDMFAAALQSNPDWIVMTSFNEWWENTHIEPSVLYGYDYVFQTADLASQFSTWHALPVVHVDASYTGPENGSAAHPYNTLNEAIAQARDGATLRVAKGAYTGPITLTRSITIEGGYDPADWSRDPVWRYDLATNPTIIQGNGSGPVVRIPSDPCSTIPRSILLDGLAITGGVAAGDLASGGGICVQGASLKLAHVAVVDNSAQDHGGGVFIEENGQVRMESSRISGNTADVGGGLFAGQGSRLWLTNTLIVHNEATVVGGGLYSGPDASLSVVNSTLSDNSAPGNGAGLYAWSLLPQDVSITNSILWGSGSNDIRCLANCTVGYSDVAGGWPGIGNVNALPKFIDPDRSDYHLRHGSPAIDAGDPAGVRPVGPAPPTDIDGEPRPVGLGVDLGADEVASLVSSDMAVDKPVALLGDVLYYTITLTNTGATESLDFWVTDTLPLPTDYVSDSLRVSSGTGVYTPWDGTLWLPRILWQGTVPPDQTINLSFAVVVRPQTALHCTDIVNFARIQTEAPITMGMGARNTVERSVATQLSYGELDHIVIRDAPGGSGNQVSACTLRTGEALTLCAAGYDDCHTTIAASRYLGPISVTWQTSGTLEYRESVGSTFVFTPTKPGGEGMIIADDGQGHIATTGLISVTTVPPQVSISPATLSSTQLLNQVFTHPLTISNRGELTLTYEVVSAYTQPFELTYEWDASPIVSADRVAGETTWDYYVTPEHVFPQAAGGVVRVTEIDFESRGVNLADWIHFDWEVHLGNQDIGLPEGQALNSRVDPGISFERDAPCQLMLAIGPQRDPSSHAYEGNHSFVTGNTAVPPFPTTVKRSQSLPMEITDGLHAQVYVWTGNTNVALQFDNIRLTVRGWVTHTFSPVDWLGVDPTDGIVAPHDSQTISVSFDSRTPIFGTNTAAIGIETNDPDDALSITPVTLTIKSTRLYLPLLMRYYSPPTTACAPHLVASIETGPESYAVTLDTAGQRAFVAHAEGITVVDTKRLTVITTTHALTQVRGIAHDPDRDRIWVARRDPDRVVVLDGTTYAPLADLEAGDGPHSVVYNPTNDRVYVTNYRDWTLDVYAAGTLTHMVELTGFAEPAHVAVNPTTNKIYVANHRSNEGVIVIDGATHDTQRVDTTLLDAYGVTVDATRNLVYATAIAQGRISVIDGATDTQLGYMDIQEDGRPVWLRVITVNPNVGPQGHLLLVTSSGDEQRDQVLLIPNGWPTLGSPVSLDVASYPQDGIALEPGQDRIWVTSVSSALVSVVQDGELVCLPAAPDSSRP